MKALRRCCFLIVLLLPSILSAQDQPKPDDAAKENQRKLAAIIEQALSDIQNLRLPENRALFDCQIGNLLWPEDPARARELFRNAASELITAQNAAELKRSSNPNNELLSGAPTRQSILGIIATRDAELALDLLVKTRPLAIQRAVAGDTQENPKIGNYTRGNNYFAQNESNLQQNFYRLAAEQSPDRAVKLLKEALAKGLTNDTLNQLTRLAEKDQSAAADMASQVVSHLVRAGFMVDGQPQYTNIQLTNGILNQYMSRQSGSGQKLKFDDSQIRDLTGKFISTYLSDPKAAPYIGQSIMGIAEKLSPTSVDSLKRATNRMFPQNQPPETDTGYQKLMESDTPPEQMVAAAAKFPLEMRRQIYQNASSKFMGRGNPQAARAILDENFTDDVRDQMLNNFDQQNAYNLIGEGKFAEAEQVIDRLPEQQRVAALVNLASSVFGKDPKENKPYASTLLAKASQSTSERPENSAEMSLLMQVVAGYSNVDPAEAFRIVEGLVPKINELTDAALIINGFQTGSNVREGEFIISQGDPFYSYGANPSMISPLAKFDFDRTMHLIDGFTRPEMRISLKLQMIANGNMGGVFNLPIRSRSLDTMNLIMGGRR